MSAALFTKPKRSKLSPTAKAPRAPYSIYPKRAELRAAFDQFDRSRITAPRITTRA